jgi:hypothetical protein
MKVTKSIKKLSNFLDSRSICEKYGMTIDDPIKRKKKAKKAMRQRFQKYEKSKPKSYQRDKIKKGHYKKYTRSHYYSPEDIKLQSFKQ